MTPASPPGFSPTLTNHGLGQEEQIDTSWLEEIQQLRVSIYQAMLRKLGPDTEKQIATATDQLVGCELLWSFIRDRQTTSASILTERVPLHREQTVSSLAKQIQAQSTSSLLAAVFDTGTLDADLSIPHLHEIDWGKHRPLIPEHLALTDFGKFHQFCLSNTLSEQTYSFPPTSKTTSTRRKRGIHYTPTPLVEYLTHKTLEQVTKNKQFSGLLKIRLIDPSCGCGAFLIAALKYLFARCQEFGNPDFSAQQRLDLLKNVVHGVDIDPQAVEWTRRVLLLAVWEASLGEEEAVPLQIPDLRKNIVCGDFLSLEGPSVDAVIGGPPFVRLQTLLKTNRSLVRGYRANYLTARHGQFDLYMLFFEQAIRRLQPNGWLGWSVSNSFLRSSSGRRVRRLISSHGTIRELVEFESRKIYPDAVTQIVLVLFTKNSNAAACHHVRIRGDLGHRQKLADLLDNKPLQDETVHACILPEDACRGSKWSLDSAKQKKPFP